MTSCNANLRFLHLEIKQLVLGFSHKTSYQYQVVANVKNNNESNEVSFNNKHNATVNDMHSYAISKSDRLRTKLRRDRRAIISARSRIHKLGPSLECQIDGGGS